MSVSRRQRESGSPPPLSHSIREVMQITGMGRNLVYDMIAAGVLKSFVFGKRRLISSRALHECIEHLERETSMGRNAGAPIRRPGPPTRRGKREVKGKPPAIPEDEP